MSETGCGLLDIREARGWLSAAVETQGRDFIYNVGPGTCYYVPIDPCIWGEDSPKAKTGCLVGVALSLAGRTQDELEADGAGIVDRMG